MRIVVDAMGSDDHPKPDVAGAVEAAREFGDTIILVGDEAQIKAELATQNSSGLSLEIVHASEAISMEDKPSKIVKSKPNSSMHVGLSLVKNIIALHGEHVELESETDKGTTVTLFLPFISVPTKLKLGQSEKPKDKMYS